ncbi:hypothetical protein [Pseudomonas fluorescens]|uniref:hypothetical protein n=1 Tax=Pseudomonas fluorescens TaxID=294 RepID=UPI0011B94B71|nr:hypothetical protein [Pseudomonas fluorescens]
MNDEDRLMRSPKNEKKTLWQREKNKREALWQLQGLRPGDPAAGVLLNVLDVIEAEELVDPIGPAFTLSSEEIRNLVPVIELRDFRIIRDEDIPQPWLERFTQASTGSTRLPEGSYSHDWLNFLNIWQNEMRLLARHRQTRDLWQREARRWELLQQLRELNVGDPTAGPLLEALEHLESLDDPRIKTLDMVSEIVRGDVLKKDIVLIPDRRLPLPWNLRFAHFLGHSSSNKVWWSSKQWLEFLDAWKQALEHVERHRLAVH